METKDDERVLSVEAQNNMTPAQVAHRCGVSTADVMRLNRDRYKGLKVDSKLEEGTQLLIPAIRETGAGEDGDVDDMADEKSEKGGELSCDCGANGKLCTENKSCPCYRANGCKLPYTRNGSNTADESGVRLRLDDHTHGQRDNVSQRLVVECGPACQCRCVSCRAPTALEKPPEYESLMKLDNLKVRGRCYL